MNNIDLSQIPEYDINNQGDTFHLGLTMAGAVSAGAYTGGVMDYLFEALHNWDLAKKGELDGVDIEDVPKHCVMIDAMGGTSAGGMTTIMAAIYAIKNKINPVRSPHAIDTSKLQDNIFWDSWIKLDDDDNQQTLIKALSTSDLDESGKILSLLNTQFIDNIAKRAFSLPGDEHQNPVSNLPDYFSRELQVLISHSMIRGIPLTVPFTSGGAGLNTAPSHSTYEHFLFSHFHLNGGNPTDRDQYIWLNPYERKSKYHLAKAAMATGAFPVGLKFREFDKSDFSTAYIKNVLSRLIIGDMSVAVPAIKDQIIWDNCSLDQYLTNSIDGGALNNEPYAEVQSLVKCTGDTLVKSNSECYQMQGMVMIDPFPDFFELRSKYEHADNLASIIPGIIGTLWDQAKVKRREMLDQFDNPMLRGTIFPVKYDHNGNKIQYPIACASLDAFGGFLDERFRIHDYFLGRNNARTYLRSYFSVPYDPGKGIVHPLHRDPLWTDAMRQRFLIRFPDGSAFLPLIPDMNMLLDNVDSKKQAMEYDIPNMPQVSESDIQKLSDPIEKRSKGMIELLITPIINQLKIWKILKWLIRLVNRKFLGWISQYASSKAITVILNDLKERKLLKE